MQGNLAQRVAIKSGRNVKSDSIGTGGSARGRWAESSGLTASAMLDEHFPSLGGGTAPYPLSAEPSENAISYQKVTQQNPKQASQKKHSPEEQFPSLGVAASTLSNFRAVHSSPNYRNISGHQPA